MTVGNCANHAYLVACERVNVALEKDVVLSHNFLFCEFEALVGGCVCSKSPYQPGHLLDV